MTEATRECLRQLGELQGRPTGILRIEMGECPWGATAGISCVLCSSGHLMDCHFPQSCEEAQCEHWKRAQEEGC